MKKKLFILGLVMAFCKIFSAGVWAEERIIVQNDSPYNGMSYEEFSQAIRDEMEMSEEFQKHKADDPGGAEEALQESIDKSWEIYLMDDSSLVNTRTVNAAQTNGWVNATNVQQKNSYYCGPATVLNAIAGWGGYVAGSTNIAKQDTLANRMGTNSSEGTYVYQVKNALNAYLNSPTNQHRYDYVLGSSMTTTTFLNAMRTMFPYDRSLILHARTAPLSYYNGADYHHYILVTAFNTLNGKTRLNDPHWNNSYYGIRSVPTSEALATVKNYSGRYLIW
ncbi:MAG: C39 family peptidase [Bacillota bacterium]|nr:C39 family peptidase [Bacillota bacterium]